MRPIGALQNVQVLILRDNVIALKLMQSLIFTQADRFFKVTVVPGGVGLRLSCLVHRAALR